MRALWSGTISFGLVTIPVKLVAATEDRSVRFNQLRASDHSRVGYQRVAKADDEPVDNDEIVKGYQHESGQWVVFDKDELDALKPESSRVVEIQQFVPLEQIDPIYFSRSYYVAPDERGSKAYGLLARAMEAKETVAVCTITLRDTEHLATLRLRDGVFVLATMHWPDEVRAADHADLGVTDLPEPRRQEVTMAEQLIDSLTEDFDPSAFSDSYRERIHEAVEAKVAGREVVAPSEEGEPAPVVDLMDALRQSMQRAGGDDDSASEPVQADSSDTGEQPAAERDAAEPDTAEDAEDAAPAAKKSTGKSTRTSPSGSKSSSKKSTAKSTSKSTSKKATKKSTGKKAAKKSTKKSTSGGRTRKAS